MRFTDTPTMVVIALAVIGVEAALIVVLLVQRARGRAAQSARQARLDAVASLAASMVHDIRQPLNAILMNAKACLRWLDRPDPDVAEIRAALTDVIDAGQRADHIVRRSREVFDDQSQGSVSKIES
jgi:signal transduction histidine kinase